MQRLSDQIKEGLEAGSVLDIERSPDEVCLATWWRQATPSVAYVRNNLPAKHLPGQCLAFGMEDARLVSENPVEIVLPRQRGVAIWSHLGDNQKSRVALQLRRQGVRTLMEVDDNYLRRTPAIVGKRIAAWMPTHQEAVTYGSGHSNELHRAVAEQMDGMIVSTPYLLDEYRDFLGDEVPVYLAPNCVDPDDWPLVVRPSPEDDILRIGYAGSNSHLNDWPLVKKALKWASRQPNVEVHVIGFQPTGWSGPVTPWAKDLHDYRLNLQRLDVGVAPLRVNAWSNGKSDLKALEYAMAGVMPIVQRSESYRPWWAENLWPWAASSEADWADAIRDVVRLGKSGVREQAELARQYVLRERTIQKHIGAWKEAVFGQS